MADWHDIDSVRDDWIDAPLNDDVLTELLAVAKTQVMAYARKVHRTAYEAAIEAEEVWDVPDELRLAQRRHVENMWNAGRVDTGGGIGSDDFVMKPHPIDWHVKQLIRPRRGVPRAR